MEFSFSTVVPGPPPITGSLANQDVRWMLTITRMGKQEKETQRK